ncbi:hypothetical protein J6590_005498, partial [Homalodisca vitripennis]
ASNRASDYNTIVLVHDLIGHCLHYNMRRVSERSEPVTTANRIKEGLINQDTDMVNALI